MYDTDLTPAALAAIDKVEKLLRLAKDGRGNENEAQSALDMAHRILEAHNLDMALVERKAGDSAAPHAKREDKTTGGGLYKWQRAVWEETAKLNMCRYFAIRGLERGSKYENRVVGKPENVLMTRLMAEYLQETIERLAADYVKAQYPPGTSRFIQEAIIFREGMADTISLRLRMLHRERVKEAERKAREQKATQNHPGAATTGTALTIVDVMGSEDDLNNDHLNGWELGRTARERRESEARVNERNRRRTLWTKNRAAFMAEFLEDTAAQQCQQTQDRYDADYQKYLKGEDTTSFGKGYKASKGRASRSSGYSYRETAEDRRRAQPSFYEGQEAGRSVGLDSQITQQRNKRIG